MEAREPLPPDTNNKLPRQCSTKSRAEVQKEKKLLQWKVAPHTLLCLVRQRCGHRHKAALLQLHHNSAPPNQAGGFDAIVCSW